ncbi:hypothetical protein MIR68_004443 [Amoeboaphelidium protococcarum]|nr:hypothetical protein MIR68_004443 [Amoeboaphelidium protococcarum]
MQLQQRDVDLLEKDLKQLNEYVKASNAAYKSIMRTIHHALEFKQEELTRRSKILLKLKEVDYAQLLQCAPSIATWFKVERKELQTLFAEQAYSSATSPRESVAKWNSLEDACNVELTVTSALQDRIDSCHKMIKQFERETVPNLLELAKYSLSLASGEHSIAQQQLNHQIENLLLQHETILNDFDKDLSITVDEISNDKLPFGELILTAEYAFILVESLKKDKSTMVDGYKRAVHQCQSILVKQLMEATASPILRTPESAFDIALQYGSPTPCSSDLDIPQEFEIMDDEISCVDSIAAPRLAIVRAKKPHQVSSKLTGTVDALYSDELKFQIGDYLYVLEWGNDQNVPRHNDSSKSQHGLWWYCEDEDGNFGRVWNPRSCLSIEKFLHHDDDNQEPADTLSDFQTASNLVVTEVQSEVGVPSGRKKSILQVSMRNRWDNGGREELSLLQEIQQKKIQSFRDADDTMSDFVTSTPQRKVVQESSDLRRKMQINLLASRKKASGDFIQCDQSSQFMLPQDNESTSKKHKAVLFDLAKSNSPPDTRDPRLNWTSQIFRVNTDYVPRLVMVCVNFLIKEERLSVDGLFKVSGNKSDIEKWFNHYEQTGQISVRDLQEPTDAAALLRLWCHKTHLCVIKSKLLQQLNAVYSSQQDSSTVIRKVKTLLNDPQVTSPPEFNTLKFIVGFFVHMIAYQSVHIKEGSKRMNKRTIARIFGPSLFCNEYSLKRAGVNQNQKSGLMSVIIASTILESWIAKYEKIFL